MSVRTLQSNTIPKLFFYIVLVVVGAIFLFFIIKFGAAKFLKGNAGLSVETLYGQSQVYLDDELLGSTPFTSEEIPSGKHKIRVANDINSYEVSLDFLRGTQVVINRDLGVSDTFSSGQSFWISRSNSDVVLSVISQPSDATVYIDDIEVGQTPYSATDLSTGEYDLRLEALGYETQSARINIEDGFRLNMSLDLFPLPVTSKVELFEGSDGLYTVHSANGAVTYDTGAWVLGVLYWGETRGINLAGGGIVKDKVFDYFLDYKGNLYDKSGGLVTDPADLGDNLDKGIYLNLASNSAGLTPEAKETYITLSDTSSFGKTVVIKPTGLGWLRVRSEPNLNGTEVAKVDVGKSYSALSDVEDGWIKLKVSDTTTGWVSADYVEFE